MEDNLKNKNNFILLFISIVLLVSGLLLAYLGFYHNSYQTTSIKNLDHTPTPAVSEATESALLGEGLQETRVVKVIDGDTIEIENGIKVRYLGIDTPETVDPRRPVQCFGVEASNENKKLVEGKKIYLEKDISETDKYSRLLRYIYIETENGEMLFVNDYLVRMGYAKASTYPPDVKYNEKLKQAEQEARQNSRGLWGSCS